MGLTAGELEDLLARYDQLVADCAAGRISFGDFLDQYGCFYLENALDGHEFDVQEQEILRQYEKRIALHREITESIVYRITAEEFLSHPDAAKAGFIGEPEALTRLKALARQYLNIKE